MTAKIRIHNLDQVKGAFDRMAKSIQPTMIDTTTKAVLYVHSKMPAYPPAPASSGRTRDKGGRFVRFGYKRTMQLFRSITRLQGKHPNALSRVEKGLLAGSRGFIGTNLEYAQWVIDEEYQAWFHTDNGWWTLQEVIEDEQDAITDIFEDGIEDMLRKLNLI